MTADVHADSAAFSHMDAWRVVVAGLLAPDFEQQPNTAGLIPDFRLKSSAADFMRDSIMAPPRYQSFSQMSHEKIHSVRQ